MHRPQDVWSTKFYKAAMEKIGTAYHLRASSFTPLPLFCVGSVLLIFSVLCIFVLCLASNVACVSGLSVLDYLFGFCLKVYILKQQQWVIVFRKINSYEMQIYFGLNKGRLQGYDGVQ